MRPAFNEISSILIYYNAKNASEALNIFIARMTACLPTFDPLQAHEVYQKILENSDDASVNEGYAMRQLYERYTGIILEETSKLIFMLGQTPNDEKLKTTFRRIAENVWYINKEYPKLIDFNNYWQQGSKYLFINN